MRSFVLDFYFKANQPSNAKKDWFSVVQVGEASVIRPVALFNFFTGAGAEEDGLAQGACVGNSLARDLDFMSALCVVQASLAVEVPTPAEPPKTYRDRTMNRADICPQFFSEKVPVELLQICTTCTKDQRKPFFVCPLCCRTCHQGHDFTPGVLACEEPAHACLCKGTEEKKKCGNLPPKSDWRCTKCNKINKAAQTKCSHCSSTDAHARVYLEEDVVVADPTKLPPSMLPKAVCQYVKLASAGDSSPGKADTTDAFVVVCVSDDHRSNVRPIFGVEVFERELRGPRPDRSEPTLVQQESSTTTPAPRRLPPSPELEAKSLPSAQVPPVTKRVADAATAEAEKQSFPVEATEKARGEAAAAEAKLVADAVAAAEKLLTEEKTFGFLADWTCSACTFVNEHARSVCSVCETKKPPFVSLAASPSTPVRTEMKLPEKSPDLAPAKTTQEKNEENRKFTVQATENTPLASIVPPPRGVRPAQPIDPPHGVGSLDEGKKKTKKSTLILSHFRRPLRNSRRIKPTKPRRIYP